MRLIALALLLLISTFANAQAVFIVQNDTSASAHDSLTTALDSASNGDYIYMPGGVYNIGTVYIDKQVHIIGAGENPDTSMVTSRTQLNGGLVLMPGASGSSLEGFYLSEDVHFGTDCATATAQNILFRHISADEVTLSYDEITAGHECGVTNIVIRECRIRNQIYCSYNTGIIIQNNLLGKLSYVNSGVTVENNIFNKDAESLNRVSNITFTNNIFARQSGDIWVSGSYGSNTVVDNTFNNNIFTVSSIQGMGTTNNCQFNTPYLPLFTDVTGFSFSYDDNFHLVQGSAAEGTGFNGADCGIYGGDNPAKDGFKPLNPHFQTKSIPISTNAQGELQIELKVEAQDQ